MNVYQTHACLGHVWMRKDLTGVYVMMDLKDQDALLKPMNVTPTHVKMEVFAQTV